MCKAILKTFNSRFSFTHPAFLFISFICSTWFGFNAATVAAQKKVIRVPGWVEDAPLNVARSASMVVTHNNFIYVIGGGSREQSGFSQSGLQEIKRPKKIKKAKKVILSSVEYARVLAGEDFVSIPPNSINTLTPWKYTSSTNIPRAFAAAVVAKGYIYLIGGEKEMGDLEGILQSVERAKILPDGSLGEWILEKNELETFRRGITAFYHSGYLYVVGGYNGSFLQDVEKTRLNPDGSLGEWVSDLHDANSQRYVYAGVSVKNRLYLIGGHFLDRSQSTNSVEWTTVNQDGSLNPWKLTSPMLSKRFGAGAAVVGKYIYVAGGHNSILLSTVERAQFMQDGSLGNWVVDMKLPRARFTSPLISVGNIIYSIGGADNRNYLQSVLRTSSVEGEPLGFKISQP